MKIGDRIKSSRIRPNDIATITRSEIKLVDKENKTKKEVRSKYTAEYDDGSSIIFYGFDIGRTISLVEECKQITIFDYCPGAMIVEGSEEIN